MSKNRNYRPNINPVDEVVQEEEKEEVLEVADMLAEVEAMEEVVEEDCVEEIEEIKEVSAPVIGVVAGCKKLNVRCEGKAGADVVCEIAEATEVVIDEKESTEDFYKICTEAGAEGFCMKKYITLKK